MLSPLNYRVTKIQLFNTKFENEQVNNRNFEEQEIREYGVEIDIVIASSQWLIAFCEYKVATRFGEANCKLVKAVYTITLNYESSFSPQERAAAVKEVAGKQAWMMFREYFSVLNNQAELKLPALPLEPANVVVSDHCKFEDFDFGTTKKEG